jgi:replication factor C subunit 3/5
VADGDCPHILFYGPSGAGKKTLVLALLREIFGAGVERVKVEGKAWKIEAGSRKVDVELTLLSSNHHVEMNPSDAGSKDRYVVQEVIKEMARARPISADGTKGYKGALWRWMRRREGMCVR